MIFRNPQCHDPCANLQQSWTSSLRLKIKLIDAQNADIKMVPTSQCPASETSLRNHSLGKLWNKKRKENSDVELLVYWAGMPILRTT